MLKLPPPLTGATLMNQYIVNSKVLKDKFDIQTISISYKKDINDKHKYSFMKIFSILKFHFKLCRKLIIFKPSIVYFQISPLGIAFLRDCTYVLWLKIFRVHAIYHLHGKGIKGASYNSAIMRGLYRWAFNGSSVICLSNLLVDDISTVYSGVPYIVNNGIAKNTDIFEKYYANMKTLNVLFLSNLLYSKGILVLLDSLLMLDIQFRKKIRVQIVGEEAELSERMLNEEISKRGLSNFIVYLGPKYGDEKTKIYKTTDILIYPTLNDVWGLVLLEAMQFGIPVIASVEGAIPEIVDNGVTGFLVEKNRPDLIAEKMKILIENNQLRKEMCMTARNKFLEKYTLEIFEQNMANVFQKIIVTNK